jgi:predicted GNAT family acetyltransferase
VAVEVKEALGGRRFEVYEDGELAGYADCVPDRGAVAIPHTEVDPARGGRGLASELIRVTLDTLRERDTSVLPYCPFVSAYIGKHPEYVPLVPEALRSRFGLPA